MTLGSDVGIVEALLAGPPELPVADVAEIILETRDGVPTTEGAGVSCGVVWFATIAGMKSGVLVGIGAVLVRPVGGATPEIVAGSVGVAVGVTIVDVGSGVGVVIPVPTPVIPLPRSVVIDGPELVMLEISLVMMDCPPETILLISDVPPDRILLITEPPPEIILERGSEGSVLLGSDATDVITDKIDEAAEEIEF